jgi:hypothetical protein
MLNIAHTTRTKSFAIVLRKPPGDSRMLLQVKVVIIGQREL